MTATATEQACVAPAVCGGPTAATMQNCSLQAQKAAFLTQAQQKKPRRSEEPAHAPAKRARVEADNASQQQAADIPAQQQQVVSDAGSGKVSGTSEAFAEPANPGCACSIAASSANDSQVAICQQQPQAQAQPHYPPHHQVPEAIEHTLPPGATVEEVEEEEADFIDFDPLLFIKSLPPLEQVVPKQRQVILPKKPRHCKQKTLVLDLDETLVHSSLEAVSSSDFTFPVHFNNQEHVIHVKQRPHLHTFMNRVAELFEVVVFTASQKIYAEKLLNIIDPTRKLIKHRIFRDSCVIWDGNYVKDLTVLGRDLRSTLIVDNSPQAFGFQVDNGVPIESWYDDEADEELLKMLPFLEGLVDAEDVRLPIQRKFRMRELIEKAV
ncbi:HAD-like domain-containing protein [Haematococcus lacustris]